jgi:hypothetical protein
LRGVLADLPQDRKRRHGVESPQSYCDNSNSLSPKNRCRHASRRDSQSSQNYVELGVNRPNPNRSETRFKAGNDTEMELSPFADWHLGEIIPRRFMTDGLLRIYHDSMENALSCWLTEHNCPYTTAARYKKNQLAYKPDFFASAWDSMWSNRMYARVCHLDRAYAEIRKRPLTGNDGRLASQALSLAILAFASQWAQAGPRSKSSPENYTPGLEFSDDPSSQEDVFGRSMQETLWHQASRVLQQAAHIESFRVVFALIIFSLTQRPLDITQPEKFRDLQQIIEGDGAPLFLEMALRQIFSFRRKLEDFKREQLNSEGWSKQNTLEKEDRETFNLLYWLAVMFDTLSAAMCQRPLVVEDEDSDLPPVEPEQSSMPNIFPESSTYPVETSDFDTFEKLEVPSELWGDRLISHETIDSEPAAHWPCSYQQAASTLSFAAPVKVLLFRRVARLQTLLSRKKPASKIESAIKDSFLVYDYWNRIYNPFILDCIANHDELPARIQSWYVLLAGHWHLATFLLSDLISIIDKTHLSLPTERLARQTSQLVSKLRWENALAVADLSRASLHGSMDRSFQNAREFHFAVNKAALLTEPWTVVLIRSLSRGAYILAETATRHPNTSEQIYARTRCSDCIKALWFLGRKSDMSFLAARYLSNMISESPTPSSSHVPEMNSVERETESISSTYNSIPKTNEQDSDPFSIPALYFIPNNEGSRLFSSLGDDGYDDHLADLEFYPIPIQNSTNDLVVT